MRLEKAINISDLHRMARRRLPRIIFDYIEGGCEDELCLANNIESFSRLKLTPRYLTDVSTRSQAVTLFGRRYSSPFGIAPTGLAALYRPGADLMLAEAAKQADIPFIQSGASTASIEQVARVAPDHAWYQLYQPRDAKITENIVGRARDAGIQTLVITVDAQGGANQERNIRNGFTQPLKMTLGVLLEALAHPGWVIDYLRSGMPMFEDWKPYAGPHPTAATVAKFVASQGRAPQTWQDVDRIRSLWPGNLVLKGILHPADARQAVECGVDGIVVSNHGGRKLDRAPAPADVFPAIHAAVGGRIVTMLDSGIRRGADIISALCLGATFCFVGRATLYGVAASGLPGAKKAVSILNNEIDLLMGQLGCAEISRLSTDNVFIRSSGNI